MVVEFSIDSEDLKQTLKPFFAGRARGKAASLDYVDIQAHNDELELTSTGLSGSPPAEVASPGRARLPYQIFEAVFRQPTKLGSGRLKCVIQSGEIKVGTTQLKFPGITILGAGTRVADLPIDAPLADVLALTLRFSPEELDDSGLGKRVTAAEDKAEHIIERAAEALAPLSIGPESVRSFVWAEIRRNLEV